jgi:hypothetical protein
MEGFEVAKKELFREIEVAINETDGYDGKETDLMSS